MQEWRQKGQLAGFVTPQELLASRLRLARGVWSPSEVELLSAPSGEELRFQVPLNYANMEIRDWGWTEVKNTTELVEEFLQVETPGQALRFAKRYGPIYVCGKHTIMDFTRPSELPAIERGSEMSADDPDVFWPGSPLAPYSVMCRWTGKASAVRDGCHWEPREPVKLWLACARQAAAALRLVAQMQANQPLHREVEAWRDLMLIPADYEDVDDRSAVESAQGDLMRLPDDYEDLDATLKFITDGQHRDFALSYLADWINGFPLDSWPIRLFLDENYELRVDTGLGFLPVVWLVIAQTAGGGRSVQVCAGCHRPYIRPMAGRAPKTNHNSYCDSCGRKKNWSAAKRLSQTDRMTRLRQLADFVLTLSPSPVAPKGDVDYLRRCWNNLHPDTAYVTVDAFLVDMVKMLKGSYRAVVGKKLRDVSALMSERHGFDIDDLVAKEEA